jgi:hypothetical protein
VGDSSIRENVESIGLALTMANEIQSRQDG